MRSFLTPIFKDNINLYKGIMTGILRVSKESIFSGLNNLSVCGISDEKFSTKFGFTNEEVEKMLKHFDMDSGKEEVKTWYNGYIFGKTEIYNPWSIINYVYKGEIGPYWVNTSSNGIIVELIKKYQFQIREKLEKLISGGTIEVQLNENIVFPEIMKREDTLWNFLYNSGYLKCIKKELRINKIYGELQIPNLEILSIFQDSIMSIIEIDITSEAFSLLHSLVEGKIQEFEKRLQDTVINIMSVYDVRKDTRELTYHAFVLGLVSFLTGPYKIRSNRESGFGRYDIAIIPIDKEKLGFVMEFKMVTEGKTREEMLEEATQQVKENRYNQELKDEGIQNIKQLAIIFEGKDVTVHEIT
jgi:hypothetical protein